MLQMQLFVSTHLAVRGWFTFFEQPATIKINKTMIDKIFFTILFNKMLTALTFKSLHDNRFVNPGADYFLRKPVDFTVLKEKLKALCNNNPSV